MSDNEKKAPGGSFGAHARDLIRGLVTLGHECIDVPYDLHQIEKEKIYESIRPDYVVIVDAWNRISENVDHALRCHMRVIPFLVSDYHAPIMQRPVVDLLNNATQIFVPSSWTYDCFIRDGVDESKLRIVKESVDTTKFCPPNDLRAVDGWRQSHGIRSNDLMILTIGGEIEEKGGYEIIQAIRLLRRSDIKYVVKVWWDHKMNQQNRDYIHRSGIEDQVVMIQDVLNDAETVTMIQACDIYAAPSRNEGFGRPHIEAQACGKPVITIDASAARENVRHLETGYITKVARTDYVDQVNSQIPRSFIPDINDLARGISLLSESATRERLGKAARQYAMTLFDTRIITEQFLAALS